ncbi:hypothetical protein B0J14DRAFT_221485 [Halenospora varia]|nr:hypothetical protein B0J14DRAFT_221485 [Halenospora varia]
MADQQKTEAEPAMNSEGQVQAEIRGNADFIQTAKKEHASGPERVSSNAETTEPRKGEHPIDENLENEDATEGTEEVQEEPTSNEAVSDSDDKIPPLHLVEIKQGFLCCRCLVIYDRPVTREPLESFTSSYEVKTSMQSVKKNAEEGCYVCHTLYKTVQDARGFEQVQVEYRFISQLERRFNTSHHNPFLTVHLKSRKDEAL